MSALASAIGKGAVSPPEVDTCISTECPPRCSEKYRREPSVTRERLEAPSLVICKDEKTAGGDSGDLNKSTAAINAAKAMKPAASQGTILVFAFWEVCEVENAVANNARILSFESGAGLTADPVV